MITVNKGSRVTCVGSRTTPKEILALMRLLGYQIVEDGGIVVSGDAGGADGAFYSGVRDYCEKRNYINCSKKAEVYIPWNGFKGFDGIRKDTHFSGHFINFEKQPLKEQALEMAAKLHPNWTNCSKGARALHGRNMMQVLGRSLDRPSDLEILWAPITGNTVKGGTRSAYELARLYGVPCINLVDKESIEWALSYLGIRRSRWMALSGC